MTVLLGYIVLEIVRLFAKTLFTTNGTIKNDMSLKSVIVSVVSMLYNIMVKNRGQTFPIPN